jgi:hypothetical protein
LSWATAATNIQQAVNTTGAGAEIVVSNGVYPGGVTVTDPLALLSVNGPQFTVINGGGPCVSLTDGASLTGFTVRNGYCFWDGGGVRCASTNAFLSNCVIVGNSAPGNGGGAYGGTLYNCTLTGNAALADGYGDPGYGGGAYGGTLYNCALTGNSATYGGAADSSTLYSCTLSNNSVAGFWRVTWYGALQYVVGCGGGEHGCTLYNCTLTGNSAELGGGACWSTNYNCTLTGNSATGNSATGSRAFPGYGGGAYDSTLYNCIIYFNNPDNVDSYYGSSLNYCCTTPLCNGVGNISVPPQFVGYAHGNLRLQSNSPCINSGNNAYVFTATDLDGRPRIVSGTVDMGAYEFQPGIPGAFIGWLQHYGLPTDGSADFTDPDGDHYNNWQEWLAGSNPTNPLSAPPYITVQPGSQVVVAGNDATFSVTAIPVESGLSYQWRFNDTNDIPNATNASLTLANVQSASDGLYSVRVTNVFGAILSSNAALRVDHPPLADASATHSPLLSANGVNATVVLDGSRSSDPDGAPLRYTWWEQGSATALATGVVAVVVLPVGVHSIDLVVSDGYAASTNDVSVAVLTTSQWVQRLISLVNQSGLAHPKPLTASLEAALASLTRDNSVAAANQLQAFQNKVSAQVGKSAPALAQTLIAAAQQVIDALQGNGSHALASKLHALKRQPDGKVQLGFSGLAGQVHIVEASTNLVDWEMIGVAADNGDGTFSFEDANAARLPNRYYRIVSP